MLLAGAGGITAIVTGFFVYKMIFYHSEMNTIEEELNQVKDAKVTSIWGHEDITLEEVSARVNVKNKGDVVLWGLSEDVFDYPNRVVLNEIGGYIFRIYTCKMGAMSVGYSIDIGKNSLLGNLIGMEFNSPGDVIANYDKIISVLSNLKQYPEKNHFKGNGFEQYLYIKHGASADTDPVFLLSGAEDAFKFSKTLPWEDSKCTDF